MYYIDRRKSFRSLREMNFQANDWSNTLPRTSLPKFWFTRKRIHCYNVSVTFSQALQNTDTLYTVAIPSVEMVPGYCKYVPIQHKHNTLRNIT